MSNDSTTGGYLAPSNTYGEVNDLGLEVFMQGFVVGVTGMDGTKVFPRWQPEDPQIPPYGTDWAAVGDLSSDPDAFAWVNLTVAPDTTLQYVAYQNEVIDFLVSFYGPNAGKNARIFYVGCQVPQNRETLTLKGYGLVRVSGPVKAPEKLPDDAGKWTLRVDVPFSVRRAEQYVYPVLPIAQAEGSISDGQGNTDDFETKLP